MELFVSVLIGTAVGGLALPFRKSSQSSEWSILAVGILGALLGMVGNVWIGFQTNFSAPIASSLGAILVLLLWVAAQKLFFAVALPEHSVVEDDTARAGFES